MEQKRKFEVIYILRHITGGKIIKNTSCSNYPPVLPR